MTNSVFTYHNLITVTFNSQLYWFLPFGFKSSRATSSQLLLSSKTGLTQKLPAKTTSAQNFIHTSKTPAQIGASLPIQTSLLNRSSIQLM